MSSSQPPPLDASHGPGPGGDRAPDQAASGPVRPATLAGSVLALLTYLCGFFGAYDLFFPMTLVLAGGVLALLGMLPRVGRVLVPAAVLTSTGFFLLLLNATSPGYSTGAVKWVALALALLSAAAIVTALLFEVGVLTAPAPRPARPPQAPPGWSPYGGGYGAPGQQPGPGQAGQPGLFEQGQPPYGQPPQYGYGAPQGYQGYGTPGYQAGAPGNPGPASTGGYGAVGAGGAAAGAAGYGQGYGAPAYGSPGYQGYGTPGYSAPGSAYGAGQPFPSAPGTDGPAAASGPSDGAAAAGPAASSGYGSSPGYGSTAGEHGGATSTGPSSATGGSAASASSPPSTPASAPTLAPMGENGPEATTPGVPANGGDTLADTDDERTRSFRPGENPSGS